MPAESPSSSNDFEENEKTDPNIKKTLASEEFCRWVNPDNKMLIAMPIWLNFYLKFCSKWEQNVYKKEEWLDKLKQLRPELCAEITKEIDAYNEFCEQFKEDQKAGKLATNIDEPAKILLLLKIEPKIYEAYQVARTFVKDDYELFI